MEIIETSVFTRQVQILLSEEEYRLLQCALIQKPEIGKIIPHSGGLRKMRWSWGEKGRRSGTRIIYFWAISREQILMLFIYSKNQIEDLSQVQLKLLEKLIKKD
jgi:mRNA-degrading endonuclease RelE of RelBE toxin-antitoxin system